MGRDYTKKDGKKTLLPTQRQLEKIAQQAQALKSTPIELKDIGLVSQIHWTRIAEKISPEERKKILEEGIATDKFLALKFKEALDGYKADKNWVGKNEMHDKNFVHNISNVNNRIRNAPYEVAALYDRHNRFLGFSIGDKTTVNISLIKGTMRGGTCIHNHPLYGDRNLGGCFSGKDVSSAKLLELRNQWVTAKEGRFVLRAEKGWDKVSDKKIASLDSKIQKAWDKAIATARQIYSKDKFKNTIVY